MDRRNRKWLSLSLALLAVPLMAPTCSGGNGLRQFSAGSLIIPMDLCYQRDNTAAPSYCVAPNSAGDDGVLKAYGLAYFLIKHGVAVYWIIDPNKTTVDAVDMTLVDRGEPVTHYNWTNGNTASFLGGATKIQYRGGPFVIDGQDNAKVKSLLSSDADFAQFRSAKTVDIHEAANGFTAPVARTLAGLPPTLALVDIYGPDKNSETVLENYLTAAGLNFASAGGRVFPDGGGTHGIIYDRLFPTDFLPDSNGQTTLSKNGYKLMWMPHWVGPNSWLSDDTADAGRFYSDGGTLIPILKTIGQFVDNGGDFFAECAGVGTVEGAYNYTSGNVDTTYGPALPQSESLSSNGLRINSPNSPLAAPYTFNFPASPFSQIGDFPFTAVSGAINDWSSRDGGTYVANAQRLIVESNNADIFTVVPHRAQVAGAGTVVYLGGHDYSGNTPGTRLVLNTLFNLSANCISPNTRCNTGQLGACAAGILQCDTSTGQLVCNPLPDAGQGPEVCDGIDNDCDGLVDNLPARTCYDGPAGTQNNAPCSAGTQTCVDGVWGACQGETLPTSEICNGVDDDCNGSVDLLPDGGQIVTDCYDGPLGTDGVGICHAGSQVCDPTSGTYGPCNGQQVPQQAQCSQTVDHDCNGLPDTEACQCQDGQTQSCYDGPPGTLNQGICHAGQQTCSNQQWGPCQNEQTPETEVCDGSNNDYNCNGIPQDGCLLCQDGQTQPCWDGPDGGILPDGGGIGLCHMGVEVCSSNLWSSCQQEVLPGTEICDGKDNDCDGTIDNNAICPVAESCINGNCVPTTCSVELNTCPEGFKCQGGACVLDNCGTSGVPCPVGQSCHSGSCVDPCANVVCGAGSTCSGGTCIAGGCYDGPCPSGKVCQAGQCVDDPCLNLTCPTGDFCRDGYCVPSCVFAHCQGGQVCSADGVCVDAPCGGACSSGACQPDGGCGPDACTGVHCATGQVCVSQSGVAVCVGDPCADVRCPAGVCVDGQCQRSSGATGTSGTSASSGTSATTATTGGSGSSGSAGSSGSHGASGSSGSGGSSGGSSGTGASGASGSAGSGSTGSTSGKQPKTTKPGCGCGAAEAASPLWASLLVLLGVRRRRGAALAVAAAGVLAAGAGCSGSSPPAKSSSSSSSGSGSSGSHGSSGSGSTGSHSTGTTGSGASTGTSGGSGTTGPCGAGRALCGVDCLDILHSVDHCGGCTIQCAASEICDDGFCAPTTSTNPVITTITPDRSAVGAQVTLSVTGDRFVSGSEVHFTGGGLLDKSFATTYVDAQHLTAALDLTGLVTGLAQIRVVNPGRVISNAASFIIGGGALTPTLTDVTPNSGDSNTLASLQITGTLFDSTTKIHASGRGLLDEVLPTTYVDSTHVNADFDLNGLIAGDYQLFAINAGSGRSGPLTFTVHSITPTLTSITPTSAVTGSSVGLSAQGTGFDNSTTLHLQNAPGNTHTLDMALSTEFISATVVDLPTSGPLDLTGVVPGNYQVVAENEAGSKVSSPLPFTVNSSRPRLTTLTPAVGRQGHQVALTVTGQAFDPTSVIHLLVGGNDSPQTTTYVDATSVTCTLDLTSQAPGDASIAVINSGNLASNTLRFVIQSNQATTLNLTPGSAAQGSTINMTVNGGNFEQGAAVHLSSPNYADQAMTTTFVSATQLKVDSLDTSGLPAGPFSVTVVNPNAAASAPLSFTVQPGTPTLSGLSPSSAQTNTIIDLTLTGTLFAPGAYAHVTGAGGVTADYATTFQSPTSLLVPNLTLANVPAGAYTIAVINPGPHSSGTQTFTVTP